MSPLNDPVEVGGTDEGQLAPVLAVLAGFISRLQLCEELDIHDATLRRWQREGKAPPHVKIGNKQYYHVGETRKWLLSKLENVATK